MKAIERSTAGYGQTGAVTTAPHSRMPSKQMVSPGCASSIARGLIGTPDQLRCNRNRRRLAGELSKSAAEGGLLTFRGKRAGRAS